MVTCQPNRDRGRGVSPAVRTWLIASAAALAALSPALALGQGTPDARFEAFDFEWRANGGTGMEVTITPGQIVTFTDPAGRSFHNVQFEQARPPCTGVPDSTELGNPPWQGTCRFDAVGTYSFICANHPGMKGRVVVQAVATPTPTPTPTGTSAPTTPPTATPTPTATPAPGTPSSTLKLTLARNQRSMRVRGAVEVQAGSRVEVTARTSRRVGRFLRRSAAGTVVFSVGLDAKARKTLRSKGRLRVTVRVAVTPPGAKALTRTTKVTLTRG